MRSLVLLLFFSAASFAQLYEAKTCVYHEGDDMRWAQPDYDDSGWPKLPPFSPDVMPPGSSLWLRCRIVAEPFDPATPLFVQDATVAARQVFVNGIEVGSYGNLQTGRMRLDAYRIWPLPPEARKPAMLVAVRMIQRFFGASVRPVIGSPRMLSLLWNATRVGVFLESAVTYAMCPVFIVLGLILIVMSWSETRRDVLFFGIVLLGRGLGTYLLLVLIQAPLPGELLVLAIVASSAASCFVPSFFYALRGRPLPVFYRVCACALILPFLIRLLGTIGPPGFAFWSFYWPVVGLPGVVVQGTAMLLQTSMLAAFLPLRSLRKSDLPLLALTVPYFVTQEVALAAQLPWTGHYSAQENWRSFASVAVVPLTFCFVILLTVRVRQRAQRQAALQRDMESAREMQRMLVPESPPAPGFCIDTAYSPAREVGGDFYQLLPGDDGSLLVVVGDVSGKGLDAAMLVSAVVGALGDLGSRVPADVLAHLNRALTGKTRGGFVTCCCALFHAGGTVEIANAGHIPPYVRGRELELPPGLPLGIAGGAEYESTTVSSGADAVTFLSDGVVEATNGAGELLGFDRLPGLTLKPAREIAAEAERWGQEDDITVVRVAYA